MGRDLGPVEKLSRREGVELGTEGRAPARGQERVRTPPVSAGPARPRPPAPVRVCGSAAREAEDEAAVRVARTAVQPHLHAWRRQRRGCCSRSNCALDNVVYRLGFAATRAQARQFVVHGHFRVNGRKVDRPSCPVGAGDVIALRPGSRVERLVREATSLVGRVPPWLLADHDELWGRVEREPERAEIAVPVDEKLIVEFYAK